MRTLIATTALVTATLLAVPASAQMGTGQFCLKSGAGEAKCNYQTMAQCEQARPAGSSDQCVDKSQVSGTTGAGGGASPPASSPSPGGTTMPPKAPPQ
jgi:hypothetical protein